MRLRTKTHRVLRSHLTTRDHPYGSYQNTRGSRLASTNHGDRRPVIFGFHGILSILHPQLLQNRKTPSTTNKKRHSLGVGRRPKTSLRTPQNLNVLTSSARPTELQQTIRRTY